MELLDHARPPFPVPFSVPDVFPLTFFIRVHSTPVSFFLPSRLCFLPLSIFPKCSWGWLGKPFTCEMLLFHGSTGSVVPFSPQTLVRMRGLCLPCFPFSSIARAPLVEKEPRSSRFGSGFSVLAEAFISRFPFFPSVVSMNCALLFYPPI